MGRGGQSFDKFAPRKAMLAFSPLTTHLLVETAGKRARIIFKDQFTPEYNRNRLIDSIRHSHLIENIEVSEREVESALDGGSEHPQLSGYVNAVQMIKGLPADCELNVDLVKEVHRLLTSNILPTELNGSWRFGEAVIVDKLTNTIIDRGAPPTELEARMNSLMSWVNDALKHPTPTWPRPLVAAVAHYNIAAIHPFADGNGRVARLLSEMIINQETPQLNFDFNRFYAADKENYYQAIRSVKENTFNIETWANYFLTGLDNEYTQVNAELDKLVASANN